MEKFYKFVIDLVTLLKPKHSNWVVRAILIVGLGMISQPWWIPFLNKWLEESINVNPESELAGWALFVIGLVIHFIHRKHENSAGMNTQDNSTQNVNFSVTAEFGLDPIDSRKYIDEEPAIWNKARLIYRLSTLTTSIQWSNNTIIGIVFFSGDRLYTTESNIPKWVSDAVKFGTKPKHHRLLHHSINIGQVNSARPVITKWMEAHISVNHTPWNAAIYVLAENSKAQWFQLTIKKDTPKLTPKPGQGVQIRNYKLDSVTFPIVSAGHQDLLL